MERVEFFFYRLVGLKVKKFFESEKFLIVTCQKERKEKLS